MSLDTILEKLSESYFKDLTNPVDKIYVDMELLQDFKLGALLNTVTVKEEVEYIESCLPLYNTKFNNRTAEYFPVLKKADEELLNFAKENSVRTALAAPWTRIYDNLNRILKHLYIRLKQTNDVVKPITVVINCIDITYSIKLFDIWAKEMKKIHPFVEFKLVGYPRYQAPLDFYTGFDMFFIYDHETFFNTEGLAAAISPGQRKVFKTIYSPPYINDKLGLDPSEYPQALASAKALVNLICDFYYMPTGIQLHKPTVEKIYNGNKS